MIDDEQRGLISAVEASTRDPATLYLKNLSLEPRREEKVVGVAGIAFLLMSAALFASVAFERLKEMGTPREYSNFREYISGETPSLVLLIIAGLLATIGTRLLMSTQIVSSRTIPKEDYPLISAAVIQGRSEPIDQYIKLRSLTGWAGAFTKLGITGLPLTTVLLTLVFSALSLTHSQKADQFLDLAKLTLGAFIGSFVQRSVEQRKQDIQAAAAAARDPHDEVPKKGTRPDDSTIPSSPTR